MTKDKKILIIEDDEAQVMMYAIAFKHAGFKNVIIAKEGKVGINSAQDDNPDLIILDLLLGDMSGIDVLKELKSDNNTKHIKVVILSNYTRKGLDEECKKIGAVDFLVKSHYVPKEIISRVEKYLSQP